MTVMVWQWWDDNDGVAVNGMAMMRWQRGGMIMMGVAAVG